MQNSILSFSSGLEWGFCYKQMAAEKKYICSFCARAFSRSEHKQRHERSHTNEKPFHCVHCTSAFVRRDLLQRHCKTVHNIAVSKERRHSTGSAIKNIGANGVIGNVPIVLVRQEE